MDTIPLFIGVVSHARTRFAVSQGERGLASLLAGYFPGSQVRINTRDFFNDTDLTLSRHVIQESLTREARLEHSWSQFLGVQRNMSYRITRGFRWTRRFMQFAKSPSPKLFRRLINIELSHQDLLSKGLSSKAPWILILEDDAVSEDVADLAQGLAGIMRQERPPDFVNLSRSFTFQELGIAHLLESTPTPWAGSRQRELLQAKRPATNTVCAILYARDFVPLILEQWQKDPITPIVPIDWRLNSALMHLYRLGAIGTDSCWFVEPAPITQMSMHAPGILSP